VTNLYVYLGAVAGERGSASSKSADCQNPSGVAFDAAGHIFVVELGSHRVQVLRYSDGAHV
jgi:sugar lactone lactonase YvrE